MKISVLSVLSIFFIQITYSQDVNYHTLTTTATDLNSQTSIRITGLNSPVGEASARNISFDFSSAGKARIQAYRNNSMGTTLQFLTNDDGDALGGEPSVRMQISRNGNVGIGTTNPFSQLHVKDGSLTGTISLGNDLYPALIYSSAASGEFRIDNRSSFGGYISFYPNGQSKTIGSEAMRIIASGNIGIGTAAPTEKLSVNGKIRAQEIKVEASPWPDYVFNKSYSLPTLLETEQHIKEKGHLPGIPSAAEVKANGIDLGEMNAKLLQKIEELTLHLIEKDKEIQLIKSDYKELRSMILDSKAKIK
jgi:hypothetical protein